MENNNQRAAHLSCQGPHQKRKAKSQGTEDLKPYRTRQPSALSRRNRRETSSPACMRKCVIPFSEEQKFTPTCVAWEACFFVGGKGTVTSGMRSSEVLSAALFLHSKISVACKQRSGAAALPLNGFYISEIHHCVSNKAIKSITRSSLHGLKQYKSLLQKTLLTWGWLDGKIFQVIHS